MRQEGPKRRKRLASCRRLTLRYEDSAQGFLGLSPEPRRRLDSWRRLSLRSADCAQGFLELGPERRKRMDAPYLASGSPFRSPVLGLLRSVPRQAAPTASGEDA